MSAPRGGGRARDHAEWRSRDDADSSDGGISAGGRTGAGGSEGSGARGASLEEAAEVAKSTSIPIAGDESVETRADAERAVELEACGLAGLKLSKVGGPEAAIEIAEVLPSYLSSALDGPVGIAAAAQVAQTLRQSAGADDPGLAQGLATQRLFSSTVASAECELRGGMLHLPSGPGLGVEIDEAALAAHRL